MQDAVATVLGVCFRLLADPKNSDSVVNTAAATVRQAVALVFEHVDLSDPGRASSASSHTSPRGSALSAAASSPLPSQGSVGARPGAPPGTPRSSSGMLAEHGPANAALKLLDNLCMMLTGALLRPGPAR